MSVGNQLSCLTQIKKILSGCSFGYKILFRPETLSNSVNLCTLAPVVEFELSL